MTHGKFSAGERPRQRLIRCGAEALSDTELLGIVLRMGGPNGLSHIPGDLITRFGLRGLGQAPRSVVCEFPGVGDGHFTVIQAMIELGRRAQGALLPRGELIESPTSMRRFLKARMRDYPNEVFACVFLDNRHRVIQFEPIFQGTIDGATVHPREVVRRCITHNAAAVVAAHNHPSGVAEPSSADRAVTRRLRDALALIDVRLLDHLIVGDQDVFSLAERGLM